MESIPYKPTSTLITSSCSTPMEPICRQTGECASTSYEKQNSNKPGSTRLNVSDADASTAASKRPLVAIRHSVNSGSANIVHWPGQGCRPWGAQRAACAPAVARRAAQPATMPDSAPQQLPGPDYPPPDQVGLAVPATSYATQWPCRKVDLTPPAPGPRWRTHMGSLSSPWWLRRRSPGTGGSGATRYIERLPRRGNAWRASAPLTYSVSLPARDAGRGAGERDVVSCTQPTAQLDRELYMW